MNKRLQIILDFGGRTSDHTLALRYNQLVRSTLYANDQSPELSYETLRKLAHDARVIVEDMIRFGISDFREAYR